MAMKNGRDENYDDPKIASFSAARKKAEEAKRKQAVPVSVAGRSIGELLFGAALVAMAVGLLISLTRPLWQASN